jgi:DNA-binding PucR family transcriptional regulator
MTTPAATSAGTLLEMLMSGRPDIADLIVRRVLAPLDANEGLRALTLRRTLVAYVQEGWDRRRASQVLRVHPNTLDYRLRRIEQLTGLSLTDADDRAMVHLALRGERRTR